MKALLDTQALLWYTQDDPRMPGNAMKFMRNSDNELHLSVASIWEIAIKHQLGRLPLNLSVRNFIEQASAALGLMILPIAANHVFTLADLPLLHHDPFDRIILAQAKYENLPLVTGDRAIRRYDVQIIW
jgi:PIN domain nuclease of toxin-antitoxin system